MKRELLVSCVVLGGLVGCGAKAGSGNSVAAAPDPDDSVIHAELNRAPSTKLRGPAVANYNTGYVDGWGATQFFNKGRPLTDEQVDKLIAIGRRQGDPTGKLALNGYLEGYRAGARQDRNPYEKQMSPEQAAQVRRMQGLPEAPAEKKQDASARKGSRPDHKHKRDKDTAEASAR